jgi:protein TonB
MKSLVKLIFIYFILLVSCKTKRNEFHNDIIIDPIEYQATYPGGIDSLKKFIKKNLKYPKDYVDVEGKVYVKFIVNEDGSLSDFEIAKGLRKEYDKNAIDALKKMPKWIPAKQNGKIVRSYFVVPIAFNLSH